jgi:hypothetical protein
MYIFKTTGIIMKKILFFSFFLLLSLRTSPMFIIKNEGKDTFSVCYQNRHNALFLINIQPNTTECIDSYEIGIRQMQFFDNNNNKIVLKEPLRAINNAEGHKIFYPKSFFLEHDDVAATHKSPNKKVTASETR